MRKRFSEPLPSNHRIKDFRTLRKKYLSNRAVTDRQPSLSSMVEGLTLPTINDKEGGSILGEKALAGGEEHEREGKSGSWRTFPN
jgi:hypothetical protein